MRALEAMAEITLGSLAGAGTILLAAETLPPEISSWANLGGTVVLAALAVWLITKHQPAMNDKYQEHINAVIAAHKQEVDELRETLREERKLDRDTRHEAVTQLQDIANKIYLCERTRTRPTEGQG